MNGEDFVIGRTGCGCLGTKKWSYSDLGTLHQVNKAGVIYAKDLLDIPFILIIPNSPTSLRLNLDSTKFEHPVGNISDLATHIPLL